ncbi:hypothetical protein FEM03_06910 [Phragmitibacter flavus]|uniref:Uncharacterized protein n=1 Tax=Phragmitibacter flavus TaxID=2576071 RepID=A0A5R8KI19_9BACT|nr:hypothetical protein [Phragmitibacter flavus]TLD71259.1 hypothetical protein FEM03_06910 [Phragmitibacter flavus]
MLFIPLHLVVLAFIIFLLARHDADLEWPKLALVFAPLIIIMSFVSAFLGVLSLPIYFVLVSFALHQWFYVGWGKASLISFLFLIYLIAYSFLMMSITRPSQTASHLLHTSSSLIV